MSQVSRHESVQSYAVRSLLEVRTLEPNLHIFRRQVVPEPAVQDPSQVPVPPLAATTHTGCVNDKGHRLLLDGGQPKLLPFTVMSDAVLEQLRTRGYTETLEDLYKQTQDTNLWDQFQADPSLSSANLVRLDHASHMAFDVKGAALPVALHFDYISSGIRENTYDLLALATYLASRPDIRLLSGTERRGREDLVFVTDPKEALFDIPHYNAERGRTQSVQFVWQPTAQDYARVWAGCTGKYPSTRLREQFMEQCLHPVVPKLSPKARKPR